MWNTLSAASNTTKPWNCTVHQLSGHQSLPNTTKIVLQKQRKNLNCHWTKIYSLIICNLKVLTRNCLDIQVIVSQFSPEIRISQGGVYEILTDTNYNNGKSLNSWKLKFSNILNNSVPVSVIKSKEMDNGIH